MMMKILRSKCIICEKEFLQPDRPRSGRRRSLSPTMRGKNCITCSGKCSKMYSRIKNRIKSNLASKEKSNSRRKTGNGF